MPMLHMVLYELDVKVNHKLSIHWGADVHEAFGMCRALMDLNPAPDGIQKIVRGIHETVDHCVDRLSSNLEKLRLYQEKQNELKKYVDEDTIGEDPMTNKEFIETVIGVGKRENVKVRIPEGVRTKGCKKRLISEKEKTILNAKKGSRRCGGCGEFVDHNARTCPNRAK
ncbi:hypothetical protein LXL04_003187 [Taraxacum kok-saghyz]